MINALELVSISDFSLAIVCLFLAGLTLGNHKTNKSPDNALGFFILCGGLSAFMGGLNHGFFEPLDQSYYPKLLTYIFAAGGTFCIFSYTIKVFTKGKVANILTIISYVQLVGFVLATFYIDNFILVIGNYAPILFFFFIMNVINFKKGKKEKYLTFFCIVMNLGTCVQLTKINISELIHSSTLFHVIILFGYIIMYYGIQQKRS
jgi:hypothetical protein